MAKGNPKKGKPVKKTTVQAGSKVLKTKRVPGSNKWLGIVIILMITLLVYLKVPGLDFVANWDDNVYIFNNPHIHSLKAGGFRDIFTSYHAGNYHPLTTLTYAWEMKSFGMEAKPYHIHNLILHLLNVLLVFLLFHKLAGERIISLAVAFLFALHPLHVESVAWIAERKDVLYALFFLLSLIFYIDYLRGKKGIMFYLLAFLMFILSCLSKSMAVTLPVVLILVDIWKGRKWSWKWIDKLPFIVISIVFGIAAIRAQAASGTIYENLPFTWFERFFLVSYAVVFYLFKLIIPVNQCVVHFYPEKEGLSLVHYVSPVILVGIASTVIFLKQHRKVLLFGFLFFIVTVSLVIQIIPVGLFVVAERYTYLPYLGLFLIIGYFIRQGLDMKTKLKNAVIIIFTVFGLFFIFQTYTRIDVWQNGITLFTDAIEKNPDRALVYATRGNEYLRINDNYNAIKDFSEAVKILPAYGDAHHNLGIAKYNLKDHAGAILDYNHAAALQPENPNVYYSRGLAKYESDDIKGAIEDFNMVERLAGDYMEIYNYRGVSKARLGHLDASIEDFNRAILSNPDNANAWFNRGNSWFLKFQQIQSEENLNKAVGDYRKAAGMGHTSAGEMLGKIGK